MIDKMKVYQDTELSSKAVSVYLYLCERASKETKSCYPSMKTIAKDLHLSLASVKRSIQEALCPGRESKPNRNHNMLPHRRRLKLPPVRDNCIYKYL